MVRKSSVQLLLAVALYASSALATEIQLSIGGLPESGFSILSSFDSIISNPNIQFGVTLRGPTPYQRNSTAPFKPASTSKLFTAGAALESLGPEYRWETQLQWHRADSQDPSRITGLTLIGSGDPSWGMEEFGENLTTRFEYFAQLLIDHGVREIQGPIELRAADPRLRNLRYPEGWEAQDRTACYGAQAQAFNLQINCAGLIIESAARARWEEPGVPTRVSLQIRRGTTTDLRAVEIGDDIEIVGTWAPGTPPVTLYLPIRRIEAWAHTLFRQTLLQRGIRIAKQAPRAFDPRTQSYIFHSATLAELMKPFMKKSLNMVGDALFKTLGARNSANEDIVLAGQAALRDYVSRLGTATALDFGIMPQPDFYAPEVSLHDGSGLSHQSVVTPEALLMLLQDLARNRDFKILWDSLPIAGIDGTLRERMKGTQAENYLRAKTGTLRGTYNLGGYVPLPESAGMVPFVILTRTTPERRAEARIAEDELGAELSRLVRSAQIAP